MNLKYISTLAIAGMLGFAACKKIEIKPTGQVPPDQAIKSEADVLANLNACYTPLRGDGFFGGRSQIVSELMSDVVDGTNLTGDYFTLFNYNSTGSTGTSASLYNEPYIIIQRANVTLENLALITTDATRKNAEGQAKFMRALSHFELAKMFAQPFGYSTGNTHNGVVIKDTSIQELAKKRNSIEETYNHIINDLKEAETLLPASNGNYPTNWAAKALLARVYFQKNDFANAYAYANQVLGSSAFSFDNTANFVTNRFSNPKTGEAIWWIVNEPGQTVSFAPLRNDINTSQSLGLQITPTAYLRGISNSNDRRRVWYKDSLTASGSNIYSIRKYNNPSFILPVIHVTEMKLIRAESAAELNQNLTVALGDINDITNRAYAGTLAALPGTATASDIKNRVRAERILEMVFESGDRLQQIKRIGAKGELSTVRNVPWNCNGMVLQIPATEVNVNVNFEQNPLGGCK